MQEQFDVMFEKRKAEILFARDSFAVCGQKYYVSNLGDDTNDGKTPQTPWKTLHKVSEAILKPGDGVLFKRGDLFRGTVYTKSGVTYGAYGDGDKPKFYGSERPLADPGLWEEVYSECHIWKCKEKMLDAGTLVFNEGESHSRKLIPSYRNGAFVCREDESKPFVLEQEMTKDLDLFWEFDQILTNKPSKGEDFPIPDEAAMAAFTGIAGQRLGICQCHLAAEFGFEEDSVSILAQGEASVAAFSTAEHSEVLTGNHHFFQSVISAATDHHFFYKLAAQTEFGNVDIGIHCFVHTEAIEIIVCAENMGYVKVLFEGEAVAPAQIAASIVIKNLSGIIAE
jgi:hypothetical protein